MDKIAYDKPTTGIDSATMDKTDVVLAENKRSKSSEGSRSGSLSSDTGNDRRRKSKDSGGGGSVEMATTESQRISKAIEEEDAFLDYIMSLPAMSTENIEAFNKKNAVLKRSTSEFVGGLEHLDNLYKLMEHLGQLRQQNTKLQRRVKYLENIANEESQSLDKVGESTSELMIRDDSRRKSSRNKRSGKCKSSHYSIRQSLMRTTRERSRSVGVDEIMKPIRTINNVENLRDGCEVRSPIGIKSKVSKWTKVKEAFRWEKASAAVSSLPETKSQDSGLGGGEDLRFLRVPHCSSDQSSSFSVSPADSVLSGQSFATRCSATAVTDLPRVSTSSSSSEDELELDISYSDELGPKRCCLSGDGIEETRRSKSLDGDAIIGCSDILEQHLSSKEAKSNQMLHKSHKTPWGKVKDIIQTRTGSIKKKRNDGDQDDDGQPEITEIHTEEMRSDVEGKSPAILVDSSNSITPPIKTLESVNKRRLAPMLTITLPSTEELCASTNTATGDTAAVSPPPPPPPLPPPPLLPTESLKTRVSSKPPLSPHPEDKLLKAALQPRNKSLDDTSPTQQKDPFKRQISGGSAGTSPPTPRRPSKWSKVKNAFLTSGAGNEECLHRGSNSVPSSPVKSSSFLYDLESDELSSGEYIDDNQKDNDDVFQEPTDEVCDFGRNENIHTEIQRNFEELQLKLSNEFHKKLCEWERMKNSGVGTPPSSSRVGGSGVSSGTSSVGEETPHDKGFRRKMEEWERMKSASCSKHRESVALHQLGEENLSADFKKKLEQWEKIKSIPIPQTPDTLGGSQLQFKKKITEWQKRRHGGSTKNDVQLMSPSSELPEDFHRKLQEWERLKQSSFTVAASENDSPGNKTPSPGSGRRDFTDHKKKSQHSPTGVKEKWSDSSGGQFKVHKTKHHEVKELAWLEKELHKIEREKQRLERERDKYLEREARLEKMRRAIGSGMKKQEILIPTSTGLFRFQGISQKFTRKLYEWEKARGIGPEESTFALLDPGYQPPLTSGMASKVSGEPNMNNGALLTRSKSVGSVADLVVTGNQSNLTHQPSSLSLNNMGQLESTQLDSVLQGSDEGDLCSQHDNLDDEEPEAMIVDIEDVIEETAEPLAEIPAIETQTPVYCYAPEEVTRLIDSSGSDSEKDQVRQKTVTVANDGAVHSSYQLLQENITLLNKLKKKGDICRQLEYKMEDLEGKLNVAAKIHKEELGNLAEAEDKPFVLENDGIQKADSTHLEQIKARLHELECHQELLRKEGETLQYSFAEHSEQQAALAQHLVGKVKQLQEANINIGTGGELKEQENESSDNYSGSNREDTLAAVQDLTSQLLNMAEKLEIAIGERNQEILQLRKALGSRGRSAITRNLRSSQHWFSTDSMSSVGVNDYDISQLVRQSSEELTQLPSLLTNKVLELKRGLSYLCAASDMSTKIPHEIKLPEVIAPDSPEAVSTFTIKFGKSPNPSLTHLVGEEDTTVEGSNRYIKSSEPGSPVTTTYTFTPAFMKRSPDNISSPKKEDEMKSDESEEFCKCNSPLNDISYREEDISSAFSYKDPVSEDAEPVVHIKRKSLDIKNASLSFNDDMINESTNKKVRKQKRESGERFGNFDRWRSKQNYQLDADDDNDDDDDDIDGGDVGDNDCDNVENNNQFETNVSKKITSKSAKSKKLLKTRRITDTHVTYDRNNEDQNNEMKITSAETDETPVRSCEKLLEDTNSDEDKSSSSPKIVTRRLKKFTRKNSKDESNKCSVETVSSSTNNFSTNYFNNNNNNNNNDNNESSMVMNVNVFVPTTRKIFSPVRRDSKGKASSVIGYIVDEPESAPVMNQNVDIFSRSIDNFEHNMSKTETVNRLCDQLENESKTENTESGSKEKNKEPTFILPPCWILKQTRAQSASPALQRRLFTYSRSREKEEYNRDEKESAIIKKQSAADQQSELGTSSQTENNISTGENMTSCLEHSDVGKEMNANENENQSSPDSNSIKDDNNNKNNNLNFESPVDSFRQFKKDTIGLPNLKFRTEAGFPPISPLSVRKEVKSPQKETAPSIRMMIARYNQKVTESQEAMGSKSPESGSASPIAWRSPATKRRVKAQMERYQEEVQRHLQNWVRRDFTGKVEVKKSASAGYIRSPDKEDSLNDLSSKASSEDTGCRQIKLGILKSSSAGVIKTTSPLPLKAEKPNKVQTNDESSVNSDNILPSVVCDFQSDQFSDSKTNNLSDSSGAWVPAKDDSASSVFSQSSPQASKVRALKIKKAKEEFLSRGPGGESWSSECGGGGSENDSSKGETSTGIKFNETRNRLSQVSCESESSYDGGGPMVTCSEQERSTADNEDVILIKSASAGMINVDSSTCSRIFSDQQNIQQSPRSEQGVIPKSRFGIFSKFRRARMRRHKEKNPKLDTVSTLCRQSLVVDIQRKRSQEEKEPVASTSKSCPSSPVLQKRDPQSSSWIRNPKKIFKPK